VQVQTPWERPKTVWVEAYKPIFRDRSKVDPHDVKKLRRTSISVCANGIPAEYPQTATRLSHSLGQRSGLLPLQKFAIIGKLLYTTDFQRL